MRNRWAHAIAVAALPLLIAACGSDDDSKPTSSATPSLLDELVAAGLGKYLGRPLPNPAPEGNWTKYFFEPSADGPICLRGNPDDPYQVSVRPGTTDKVLFYLEGGGACWNDDNCGEPATAKEVAEPLAPLDLFQGILAAADPDNPFAGWSTIYVPYCDGSVFSGDNVVDYAGGRVYHRGLANLSAAVDVMLESFPAPSEIVVSGSSAGGFGTFTGYGVMRVAYPDTPIHVLNDSGPGLQNPDDAQSVQDRRENWQYEQFTPESCTECGAHPAYLTDWSQERDSTLRVGLFSYLEDFVISGFLGMSGPDYAALLRDVTDDLHGRHPDRFKRFIVNGSSHTILLGAGVGPDGGDRFDELETQGIALRDWIADFLTDGPDWQDLVEVFNPFEGFASELYSDDDMWLCKPGLESDKCLLDIDATRILPDNSQELETFEVTEESDFDCFYVYPTVHLLGPPGNATDFTTNFELDPLLSQAARLSNSCRMFAPFYRQVTLSTFGSPGAQEYFDIAYGDVAEAFRHYMGQHNGGRNFVIMGHSQGTSMTMRLIQEEIDEVPGLRDRLIVALLIGGGVTVPVGEVAGGSFQNLPLCTSDEQTGCVIAYRSYAEGFPPREGSNGSTENGFDSACTNPAALSGGPGILAKSYFPTTAFNPIFDPGRGDEFDTRFILLESFFGGECVQDENGRSYLQVSIEAGPGDLRENPVDLESPLFDPGFLGTHVLDYSYAFGDLIELVEIKGAAME